MMKSTYLRILLIACLSAGGLSVAAQEQPAAKGLTFIKSRTGTDSALIVLNGVILTPEQKRSWTMEMPPGDIRDVSVLHSQSAIALFGRAATRGAIVVRTGSGQDSDAARDLQVRMDALNNLLRKDKDEHAPAAASIRVMNGLQGGPAVQKPLIVVDGVEAVSIDGADAMKAIAPDQIKSITVLKDTASTSMYGAKGVNGVILVTTKKAEKNTTETGQKKAAPAH
ncbi:hypothetical protein C7T94_01535 [Pedobacter yulinensis]|uniref:TonB-dependent receptor plug domain-containing protein n=1 Tax=Pedobacter yulinensis TaxID=2126353 RepID=A0A2T3HQU9_9SPHI|nr:TonB-dependent receptor plug domain-containing protein [Pedobacter yulinensis]PST84834.1 hypothetical protein C7T94_01535 [Pedobacter yulinensis]